MLVSQAALGRYFKRSPAAIAAWIATGPFKADPATGKYDQDEFIKTLVNWQASRLAGRPGGAATGGLDLSTERAKLAAGQTDRVAFNLAKERGEYIPVVHVTDIIAKVFSVIREKILTREGKLADALTMQELSVVTAALHQDAIEVLNELADPASYDFAGIDAAMGGVDEAGGDLHTAAESDVDRVGGTRPSRGGEDLSESR